MWTQRLFDYMVYDLPTWIAIPMVIGMFLFIIFGSIYVWEAVTKEHERMIRQQWDEAFPKKKRKN